MTDDTTNYDTWLTDEKRDRLRRMANALREDLLRQDGIGPEMRQGAIDRIERWLEEANQ